MNDPVQKMKTSGILRPLTSHRNEAGFSLVSVMMDFGLIALAALALGGLVAYNRSSEMRLKRRTQGDQVLVNAATVLQDMSFDTLHNYCDVKHALGVERDSLCLASGGKISTQPEVMPGPDEITGLPKTIDVRADWEGEAGSKGLACVELVGCQEKIDGLMLEVKTRGYWTDPGAAVGGLAGPPQILVFRKTR